MPVNIKRVSATRLLEEMVKKVVGYPKVMCVDPLGMRIVSSCLKVSDMSDLGVAVIENLKIPREPLPALPCIYFLEPCQESLTALVNDFKKSPMYKEAHLFFTSKISDALFEVIKASPELIARIGTLTELNLEYLSLEPCVFSLDMPEALPTIGPYMIAADVLPMDQKHLEQEMAAKIAKRLLTVCLSFDELPAIRYQHGQTCAQHVATALNGLFDGMERARDGPKLSAPAGGSSTLLILDRTYDPLAPMLHDFYVQGCAVDQLKITGNKFLYKANHVLLNSDIDAEGNWVDPVWGKVQHKFIGTAQGEVDSHTAELQKRPAFKMLQSGGGKAMNIKGMSDVVKDLPKFKHEYERSLICVDVLRKTMTEAAKIIPQGNVEQAMTAGKLNKEEQEDFRNLLAGRTIMDIKDHEKLRLFLLYALTQFWAIGKSMPPEVKTALMQLCGRDDPAIERALSAFEKFTKVMVADPMWNARRSKKKRDDEETLLARFNPMLKDILDALTKNTLSSGDFPYMREPTGGVAAAGKAGSAGKSMRSGVKPKWAQKKASSEGGAEEAKVPKLIIFVVGGITYAEQRVVYEAYAEASKAKGAAPMPIILGGTSLLHPSKSGEEDKPEFLKELLTMWQPGVADGASSSPASPRSGYSRMS